MHYITPTIGGSASAAGIDAMPSERVRHRVTNEPRRSLRDTLADNRAHQNSAGHRLHDAASCHLRSNLQPHVSFRCDNNVSPSMLAQEAEHLLHLVGLRLFVYLLPGAPKLSSYSALSRFVILSSKTTRIWLVALIEWGGGDLSPRCSPQRELFSPYCCGHLIYAPIMARPCMQPALCGCVVVWLWAV